MFVRTKDVNLFRSVNRELIHDIVQSEVQVFKVDITNTNTNIYGESDGKSYYVPVRLSCLIQPEDQASSYSEFGPDYVQGVNFCFLRDDLTDIELLIETGDIIYWNNLYWEVSHEIENNLVMARNPETNLTIGSEFGWNVSIIYQAHVTRRNRTQLENMRLGSNEV